MLDAGPTGEEGVTVPDCDEDTVEPWFLFALIWSIGASADNDGRAAFGERMLKMTEEAGCKCMPKLKEGTNLYDYKYDVETKCWMDLALYRTMENNDPK